MTITIYYGNGSYIRRVYKDGSLRWVSVYNGTNVMYPATTPSHPNDWELVPTH